MANTLLHRLTYKPWTLNPKIPKTLGLKPAGLRPLGELGRLTNPCVSSPTPVEDVAYAALFRGSCKLINKDGTFKAFSAFPEHKP